MTLAEILAIPEAPPKPVLHPDIFSEDTDSDPRSEIDRQQDFLSLMATIAPAVDCLAIPNAGKSSDWERVQRWKEGARAGALDLQMTWKPARIFFAEIKNGKKGPTKAQIERLNRYHEQGHHCGLYRTADTLIAHLRAAGAPFIDRWGRL